MDRTILANCDEERELPYLGGYLMNNSHICIQSNGKFIFIGRKQMSGLFASIGNLLCEDRDLEVEGCQYRNHLNGPWKKMFITGTPGYGKTYMLAAFAFQLKWEYYHGSFHYRVVYIPDCINFVDNYIQEMKYALLIAFSSPAEFQKRREIYLLNTAEAIQEFCFSQNNLLFIVDHVNVLTEDKSATKFLNLCLSSSIAVRCATVTDHIGKDLISKQRNTNVLEMFGCLDEVCY